MQEVIQEQKWKDTQQEKFLPPCEIAISYYETDKNIEGYTDTTYTVSALGDVNVTWEEPTDYYIYFETPIDINNNKLYIKWDENGATPEYVFVDYYDSDDSLASSHKYSANYLPIFNLLIDDWSEVSYIKISVTNPQSVVTGIETINIESEKTFDNSKIFNAEFTQSGDLISFELPQSGLSFEIDNSDDRFNPENPDNELEYLSNKRQVDVKITQTLIDGTTETINGGTYFIDEWDVPQNGLSATFTARDGITFMDSKLNLPELGIIDNYYRVCNKITGTATNGGYIDTNVKLENNTMYHFWFSVTVNALPSNDMRGVIFGTETSRENRLWFGIYNNKFVFANGSWAVTSNHIQLDKRLGEVFRFSLFANWDETNGCSFDMYCLDEFGRTNWEYHNSDVLTGLHAQRPTTHSIWIFDMNNNKTTAAYEPANVTLHYGSRFYNQISFGISKHLNSADPSDWEDIMVTMPVIQTTTSNVGLYYKDKGEFYPSVGTLTVDEYTVQTLYDIVTFAFQNANVNGLPLNNDGTTRYVNSLIEELRNYSIDKSIPDYDHTIAETIQLCCNAAMCIWYWDRNCQSYIVPFNVADLTQEDLTDYEITMFNSYQNSDVSLTDDLVAVIVNDGLGKYRTAETGTVQTIDNPFITTQAHANAVAKWVYQCLKLRKTLSGEIRPDIRADVFDPITVKNRFAEYNICLTSLKYSFNGAFKGSYEGKVFNSQYNNTIDNE